MKTKRILSMALALAMVLCVAMSGCGNNETTGSSSTAEPSSSAPESSEPSSTPDESSEPVSSEVTSEPDDGEIDEEAYQAESEEIYNAQLGEFWEIYEPASAEIKDLGKRYAMMAVAEAKMLEAAIMYPNQANGGNYRFSKIAPRSGDYASSGSDIDKYHRSIVTTEMIKAEDYAALKALWTEKKGTGEYAQAAKDYLTGKGYTLKDELLMAYSSDPETWDMFNSYKAVDSDVIIQTCDALMEHDSEGTLQPALAESYEVSEDGLTYTFKIRQGVKWVDNQGREVATVKADDFVAAMQHVLDCAGGLEYLVDGLIVNAHEYLAGDVTDFAEVGVSAPDDSTLVYTLTKPTPYFPSMLTYSIFYPLCRTYYESMGGTFGADFEESGAGEYGLGPDSIAYCGPFLVTNFTPNNTLVFSENASYYAPETNNIKTITWLYNDGTDPTKAYNDLQAGTIDYAVLNSSTLETAKTDGLFDDYVHITDTDMGSYPTFFNINRKAFANSNDDTKAVSAQTEEDAARTKAAMQNVHFRRALATAVDRVAYRTQVTGAAETAPLALVNSYTPWNFVYLPNEATVSINGKDTTFPEGTAYGEIIQATFDADGFPIKAYNPEADGGNGSGSGYDGWYNPEYCKSELATAAEELADLGISKENPIKIDYPVVTSSSVYKNRAEALKQSVEASSDGMIEICIVDCVDTDVWQATGYATQTGYEANYDICDLSGWAPDYDDPSTYLDTLYPTGSMLRNCGIY